MSTNRIASCFATLRQQKRAALIAYITAGDPTLDETPGLMLEIERAGADIIELGVPFSDPSADGPVIQHAMERALAAGATPRTLEKTLAAVAAVRARSQVPIVLFGYYNPLLQHGLARAVAAAHGAGVDGMLVVDLPPEESEELDGELARAGMVRVPLIAPTSSLDRARTIVARGGGFAYYVALTGVTGSGSLDVDEVARRSVAMRPAVGDLPLAVGFGVQTAEQARALARSADGVVVGSALVKAIAAAPDGAGRLAAARALVSSLRQGLDSR